MPCSDQNAAVTFHDAMAERWEQKYARSTFGRRAQTLLAMADGAVRAGEHWLDAGCGTGTIARRLAQSGCRVTAVDGSTRMIEVAERTAAAGPNPASIRFLKVADIVDLPFADGCFDGVICSSVLEYVDVPSEALSELARVLRSGGSLIVSVPNRRAWLRRGQKLAHRTTKRCGLQPWPGYMALSRHEYSREEFAQLLRAQGFEPQAWRYYGAGLPNALSRTSCGGALLMAAGTKVRPLSAPQEHLR